MLELFCNQRRALNCGDFEFANLDSRLGHENKSKSRRASNGLLVSAKDGDHDGDHEGACVFLAGGCEGWITGIGVGSCTAWASLSFLR